MKTPEQFQLIPEKDMPFNLAGETMPPPPPEPPPMICQCGSPDPSWHGDRRGYRAFCCEECWQDDPRGDTWVTADDLCSNYSNE